MHTVTISEHLVEYHFRRIRSLTDEGKVALDNADYKNAAQCARLLANNANELASLLTLISEAVYK